MNLITTGEQSVSATGAVTGTLDTSALTGDFTIKLRVRGLLAAQTAKIVIEDTANASAFSEAQPVAIAYVSGGSEVASGNSFEWRKYDVPLARVGAANNKLRVNVQQLSGAGTFQVIAWQE